MKWQEELSQGLLKGLRGKEYVAVVLFAAMYVLTIPTLDYGFLSGFVDISEGVPLPVHLGIIVVGSIFAFIFIKIVQRIVGKKKV